MNNTERETTKYFLKKKARRNEELASRLSRSRTREEMFRLFDELDGLFEKKPSAPVA